MLLQDNQVAADLGSGIGKEIIRQADGRNKTGVVHQPFTDRAVEHGIHYARAGDVGQYSSLTKRVHTFQEEIIMYGAESEPPYIIIAFVEITVIYLCVPEGDIGRYDIEIIRMVGLYRLEAVNRHVILWAEGGQKSSSQLVFLEAMDFDRFCTLSEPLCENAHACRRVEELLWGDSIFLQGLANGLYHLVWCIESRQYGAFQALDILFVFLLICGILL